MTVEVQGIAIIIAESNVLLYRMDMAGNFRGNCKRRKRKAETGNGRHCKSINLVLRSTYTWQVRKDWSARASLRIQVHVHRLLSMNDDHFQSHPSGDGVSLVWVPAPSQDRKGLVHFASRTCSWHPTGTLGRENHMQALLTHSANYMLLQLLTIFG